MKSTDPIDPRPNPPKEHPFESFRESPEWEMPPNLEGEKTTPTPLLLRLSDFPEPERSGPVMEILDSEGKVSGRAMFSLMAIMAEPRNSSARTAILAVFNTLLGDVAGQIVAQLLNDNSTGTIGPRALIKDGKVLAANLSNTPVSSQDFGSVLTNYYLKPFGGASALLNAPKFDDLIRARAESSDKEGSAGKLLLLALQMFKSGYPASISKAATVLEKLNDQPKPKGRRGPRSERRLMDIWETYRPVAHLSAARELLSWNCEKTLPNGSTLLSTPFAHEHLLPFLSLAETLRRFGAHFKPQGTNKPLLSPAETWRCPEELQLLDLSVNLPPLADKVRGILDQYRARVRY